MIHSIGLLMDNLERSYPPSDIILPKTAEKAGCLLSGLWIDPFDLNGGESRIRAAQHLKDQAFLPPKKESQTPVLYLCLSSPSILMHPPKQQPTLGPRASWCNHRLGSKALPPRPRRTRLPCAESSCGAVVGEPRRRTGHLASLLLVAMPGFLVASDRSRCLAMPSDARSPRNFWQ